MVPPSAIATLRKHLSPQALVLTPGDPGYATARLLLNRSYSPEPAVIVYCATTSDVGLTIAFAREWSLPLAIRSGGTSPAGFSANNGGLILDLSKLDTVVVDQHALTVDIGPGAKMQAVYDHLGPTGLMVPLGECMQVGTAGLALGGGFSLLSRSLGLTCDNLVAATIVLADGSVATASATEHPDLFWALRGAGGGNFGVVTSLRFQLHRLEPTVSAAVVLWPLTGAGKVLHQALEYFGTEAPAELDAVFMLSPLPAPSTDHAFATIAVYNGPADVGAKALQALTSLGTATHAKVSAEPFWKVVTRDFPSLSGIHDHYKSGFVEGVLPLAAAEMLVDQYGTLTVPPSKQGTQIQNAVGFELAGGAINQVAPDATAFVHRRQSLLVSLLATWKGPLGTVDCPEIQWANALHHDMEPYFSGEVYQNYPDRALSDWATAYYGDNLPRLMAIKRSVDPENVFHFLQSIPVG